MPNLLIVEDNNDYARALADSVDKGFRVSITGNLAEAMESVGKQVDIALVDIRLSEADVANRDGLKILEWLRTNKPAVPVIMMSAYREFDIAVDSLNLGAAYFLKKPIKVAELNGLLRKLRQGST